jgi:hypothetical protein
MAGEYRSCFRLYIQNPGMLYQSQTRKMRPDSIVSGIPTAIHPESNTEIPHRNLRTETAAREDPILNHGYRYGFLDLSQISKRGHRAHFPTDYGHGFTRSGPLVIDAVNGGYIVVCHGLQDEPKRVA